MQPRRILHSIPTDRIDEDQLADVYRYAVSHGDLDIDDAAAAQLGFDVDTLARAVDELAGQRLLRPAGPDNDRFVPVDPRVAAALLTSPMERDISHRQAEIARIKERSERFRSDFDSVRPATGHEPIQHLTGSLEVQGYLSIAADECRDEVLVLVAGAESTTELDELLDLADRLAGRGVRTRVVCQHRCRAELATRTKLVQAVAAGADVRTLSNVPRTAVVFDRAHAVLFSTPARGEPNATGLGGGEVVAFLLDLFDQAWEAGAPLETRETGYAEVADDLRRTMVALMAQGFTDEVVARKLGLSVRSCRRHIASLLSDLGAVSRFQAGVQAGRSSLVGVG